MDPRRLALVLLVTACAPASNDEAGTASTESTGSTEGSTEAETGAETGDEQPLTAELEVVHHPNQPMVVDVLVTLSAPGYATLTHLDDAGVRVARLDGDGPATAIHLRVRGLLPDAAHSLGLRAGLELAAPTVIEPVEFTTNPALPGFIAVFPIESAAPAEVDPDYRFFDLQTLYYPGSPSMFMVDPLGRTRWHYGIDWIELVTIPDAMVGLKLRDDGSVLVMQRDAARIYDELGNEQLRVDAEDLGVHHFHHELIELPNGNFMTFGWSFQDVEYPDEGVLHVSGDVILEFTPAGELVWTWDTFDHLDPQRRREGFELLNIDPDTQEQANDWTHANGLLYREEGRDGVVYLSLRHQDWILAIDHATGEILWRLGPEGEFTLGPDSAWFFHQHSPQWQPDGSLLLYDNGIANPNLPDEQEQSHAVRYQLDLDAMVATRVWIDDDAPFVSGVAGDADRTSGGHVLRLDTTYGGLVPSSVPSRLRELDPERTPNVIWSLEPPLSLFAYRAIPTTRLVGEAG